MGKLGLTRGDGVAKGKGLDSLKNSTDLRNAAVALFGGVQNLPSSIMRRDFTQRSSAEVDAAVFNRGYHKTQHRGVVRKVNGDRRLKAVAHRFSASGVGPDFGALSTFPQNIGRSMVLFYSNPGDTVFDPFAGHNSRMELTVRAGRHYVGCDLSTDFMTFNKGRAGELRAEFPKTKIVLHHTDSRKVLVRSESADFTLTSPPYWDIEYYGDEPEQLGKCPTYQEFLASLGEVMQENFRVLRPDTYAVWFINDFRKDGVMHFYHIDVIRLGRKAGFVAHDILVVDLGRSMRDCFTNRVLRDRTIPKRHEYGVVFRKPPTPVKASGRKRR